MHGYKCTKDKNELLVVHSPDQSEKYSRWNVKTGRFETFAKSCFTRCNNKNCDEILPCCYKKCISCITWDYYCNKCIKFFNGCDHYLCIKCITKYNKDAQYEKCESVNCECKSCKSEICIQCCLHIEHEIDTYKKHWDTVKTGAIKCLGCKYYWCNKCIKKESKIFRQCIFEDKYYTCKSKYCQKCVKKDKMFGCDQCDTKICNKCSKYRIAVEFHWLECGECDNILCRECIYKNNSFRSIAGSIVCKACHDNQECGEDDK